MLSVLGAIGVVLGVVGGSVGVTYGVYKGVTAMLNGLEKLKK